VTSVPVHEWDWLTAEERPSCIDNQSPRWPKPLFKEWTNEGWEIVSITVFERTSNLYMCRAVAVLRKPAR